MSPRLGGMAVCVCLSCVEEMLCTGGRNEGTAAGKQASGRGAAQRFVRTVPPTRLLACVLLSISLPFSLFFFAPTIWERYSLSGGMQAHDGLRRGVLCFAMTEMRLDGPQITNCRDLEVEVLCGRSIAIPSLMRPRGEKNRMGSPAWLVVVVARRPPDLQLGRRRCELCAFTRFETVASRSLLSRTRHCSRPFLFSRRGRRSPLAAPKGLAVLGRRQSVSRLTRLEWRVRGIWGEGKDD